MKIDEEMISREDATETLRMLTGKMPQPQEMDAVGRLEVTIRQGSTGNVRKLVYKNNPKS